MITEQKFREAIFRGSEHWRTTNKELLSCFDADKLFERIQALNDLEPSEEFGSMLKRHVVLGTPNKRNVMVAAISEQFDEEKIIEQGVALAFDRAFVTLFDRGALNKLFVVEEIPSRAQQDLDAMVARVEAAKPKPTAPTAGVVATPVPVDPVAQCVRDFHELGSKEFQRRYISDTRMRVHYEAAIASGAI